MTISPRGEADIAYSEGERLKAYQDVLTRPDGTKYLDVPTIGVGHTTAAGPPEVKMGMTITLEQSRAILASDLRKVEVRVLKAFGGKTPPQNVFDGAVSFDFNTGGILTASWVPLWLSGDMKTAEDHFMQWNKPPEIITRRKREADLIFRGKYYSPEPASPAAQASPTGSTRPPVAVPPVVIITKPTIPPPDVAPMPPVVPPKPISKTSGPVAAVGVIGLVIALISGFIGWVIHQISAGISALFHLF